MGHIQWIIFIHVENARLSTLEEHKNLTQALCSDFDKNLLTNWYNARTPQN